MSPKADTLALIDASGKTPAARTNPSILFSKNIPLYRNSELRYQSAIPTREEGRSYVVTNVGRGAVDAAVPGTRRQDQGEMNLVRALTACGTDGACVRRSPWVELDGCVRRKRVVLTVVATVKPCGDASRLDRALEASPIREVTEARRNSAPGRARIRRQPIAQGRPGVFRPTCCPACAFACANSSRSGSWVPAGTRSSLRPLHLERVKETSKTRAQHAARMLICA